MLTRGVQAVKGELLHKKPLWGTNQKIPPQGDFSKGVKESEKTSNPKKEKSDWSQLALITENGAGSSTQSLTLVQTNPSVPDFLGTRAVLKLSKSYTSIIIGCLALALASF